MSQKTVRLTMAQARGAVPDPPDDRHRRQQRTDLRRRLRHLRPRQRRRRRRGAARHQEIRCPPTAPRTSRRMALAAIAFAKASFRRRFMACDHLDRPRGAEHGDVGGPCPCQPPAGSFPARRCLRQSKSPIRCCSRWKSFADGTISANDCFRPVSRYFDRITRPEQIIPALRRAMQLLTDPADCGPVTLSLCQDVQAEAYDYPEAFFDEKVWLLRAASSPKCR